jgi:hypothetical protein
MSKKMANWKEPDGSCGAFQLESPLKSCEMKFEGTIYLAEMSPQKQQRPWGLSSLLVHSVCVSRIEYLTPWHCQYPNCGVAITLNYVSKQIKYMRRGIDKLLLSKIT